MPHRVVRRYASRLKLRGSSWREFAQIKVADPWPLYYTSLIEQPFRKAIHCIASALKLLGRAFKNSVKCPVARSENAPILKYNKGSHGVPLAFEGWAPEFCA